MLLLINIRKKKEKANEVYKYKLQKIDEEKESVNIVLTNNDVNFKTEENNIQEKILLKILY